MSSIRVRRAVHVFFALIATLQVVVAAAGPLVDAHLERQSRDVVAHVESATAKECATLHDHELCALCRELGRFKLPTSHASVVVVDVDASASRAAPIHAVPLARYISPPGSRAPPLG